MDKILHLRRSICLKSYNYSRPGAYFVTVCAHNRECLFGNIKNGEIKLNEYGDIVNQCWRDLPNHYKHIALDYFIIMPNHIHGIINIVGAGLKPAPTNHRLSEFVRAVKTFSARKINQTRNTRGIPVWQRNYYEHVIRDDVELNRIRQYIIENPLKWDMDSENPDNWDRKDYRYS